MPKDVLILNFAVVDFRREDFLFVSELVSQGGLYIGRPHEMPPCTQKNLWEWINQGCASAGGPGNAGPLMARSGLKVAIGVNLGKGDFSGLDAQGRFFFDTMVSNGIDMSEVFVHPCLATGTAFIRESAQHDRKGIVSFPNANNDFDFQRFMKSVERLSPKIVYYMYSGLSERGDADNGKALASFIEWCTEKDIITIVDNHTLTNEPEALVHSFSGVEGYRLLEPLLPRLDIFFTSGDESRLIGNTLFRKKNWYSFSGRDYEIFLDTVAEIFWGESKRTRFYGVTVKDGAYEKHTLADGSWSKVRFVRSKHDSVEKIDLVGAGDAFRAGVLVYIVRNLEEFRNHTIDFTEAMQTGNLFASRYISNPLSDRYAGFGPFPSFG